MTKDELIGKVQELKMQAYKAGYLTGIGKRDASWKMRPVLNQLVEDITGTPPESRYNNVPPNKDEWHERYKKRLMEHYDLSPDLAEQTLLGGMDNIDYTGIPEDAADEEMSYWGD